MVHLAPSKSVCTLMAFIERVFKLSFSTVAEA